MTTAVLKAKPSYPAGYSVTWPMLCDHWTSELWTWELRALEFGIPEFEGSGMP